MNDVEIRKTYLRYYKLENNTFDLAKFILNNNVLINNGAIILITPNQILFSKNNPNNDENKGSGTHDTTNDLLTKTIYNLPFDSRKYTDDSKELKCIEKIKNDQNILIRLINEGNKIIHMRAIFVELPTSVTLSQIGFLQYLEYNYGNLLKRISTNMVNSYEDSLIVFNTKKHESIYCHSFEPIINYAKENLLDNRKEIIEENYIFGTTKEDIETYKK